MKHCSGSGVQTLEQAVGLDNSAIEFGLFEQPVHTILQDPLKQLKKDAATAGFKLMIASGYRSFGRQLEIWNAKASGARPVLGESEVELDVKDMSSDDVMWAILRWSALPGASRHHWGSEIDIYDASSLPSDYCLQLTIRECEGIFGPFYQWLDEYLAHQDAWFRPYCTEIGDVSVEPWHLSYRPVARQMESKLTVQNVERVLYSQNIELKPVILRNLNTIFERYIAPYFGR